MPVPLGLPFFDGWTQFLLTGMVLLAAQWIYVVFGFGSGLLSMALPAFILPDLAQAVVLLLLVNLPTEIWVIVKDWRWISFKGLGLVGVALGSRFHSSVRERRFRQWVAVVLAVLGDLAGWEGVASGGAGYGFQRQGGGTERPPPIGVKVISGFRSFAAHLGAARSKNPGCARGAFRGPARGLTRISVSPLAGESRWV